MKKYLTPILLFTFFGFIGCHKSDDNPGYQRLTDGGLTPPPGDTTPNPITNPTTSQAMTIKNLCPLDGTVGRTGLVNILTTNQLNAKGEISSSKTEEHYFCYDQNGKILQSKIEAKVNPINNLPMPVSKPCKVGDSTGTTVPTAIIESNTYDANGDLENATSQILTVCIDPNGVLLVN